MKKPTARPASAASPETQIEGFIAKFEPEVGALVRSTRAAVRKRLPTAFEIVYDNYNFFVLGFGATERASDAIVSLACSRKGVSLCLIHGASLPDPHKVLMGGGKQTRFVRLPSAATLKEPAVAAVIDAAVAHAKTPLPKTGRGPTVVKSVSVKQRPRSAAAAPAGKAPKRKAGAAGKPAKRKAAARGD